MERLERYALGERIGFGGQAETYRAVDRRDGCAVVVKRLSFARVDGWKAIELFEREEKILRGLVHAAIPKFLDAFHMASTPEAPGGTYYLVQELVEGSNLEQLVLDGWHPTEREAIEIARRLLEISAFLHGRSPPIVHRDIKPANVIRRADGSLALVDFGAAQALLPLASGGGSTVVGTYGYMAPEQFVGRAEPASDLYSIGATLVYILSHHHPADLPSSRMRVQYRDYVEISEPFARFIDGLLEPAVEDRFESARDAQHALSKVTKKDASRRRRRKKEGADRVEKVLSPDDGSWNRVRVMEQAISAEIPPLHSPGQRLRALLSVGALGGAAALIPIGGPAAILAGAALAIGGAVNLASSLLGARLLIGKKEFSLRKELFGVPFGLKTGSTRTLWIEPELGPSGEEMSSLALWQGGSRETPFGHELNAREREWLLDAVRDQIRRLRDQDPAPPTRALRAAKATESAIRLNLLPIRRHAR